MLQPDIAKYSYINMPVFYKHLVFFCYHVMWWLLISTVKINRRPYDFCRRFGLCFNATNELLEAVESENFKVLESMLSDRNIVVRKSELWNTLI